MISVLVVDDQALVRAAICALIEREDGLELAGYATDGPNAVRETQRLRPNVVLMDFRTLVSDGITAMRAISIDPGLTATRILLLTNDEEETIIIRALRAGASGLASKGISPEDLMHAIRTVHRGDPLLSASAMRSLVRRAVVNSDTEAPHGETVRALGGLTERQTEILELVGRGLSNDAIAARLSIAASTIKSHVSHTMSKLLAHDRAQLVIFAYESGLITPGHQTVRVIGGGVPERLLN